MFTEAQDVMTIAREGARYEALFSVSQAIGTERSPAGLFQVLAKELRKIVNLDALGVVQYDDKGGAVVWHLAEKCQGIQDRGCDEIPKEDSIPWWVYQHQQPVVISSVDREMR